MQGVRGIAPFAFELDGVVNANPFTLEWTSRVFDYERSGGPCCTTLDFGSYFRVSNGFESVTVALSHDGITLSDGGGSTRIVNDNSDYQTFRIEYTPGATGTWQFFIDDLLSASGEAAASATNQLVFGDGTGAANAAWNMTSYSFSQVPEPSSGLLAVLGFVCLASRSRRRTSS